MHYQFWKEVIFCLIHIVQLSENIHSRMRELLKEKLQELGYPSSDFSLHSLRAGEVTAAAGECKRQLCRGHTKETAVCLVELRSVEVSIFRTIVIQPQGHSSFFYRTLCWPASGTCWIFTCVIWLSTLPSVFLESSYTLVLYVWEWLGRGG